MFVKTWRVYKIFTNRRLKYSVCSVLFCFGDLWYCCDVINDIICTSLILFWRHCDFLDWTFEQPKFNSNGRWHCCRWCLCAASVGTYQSYARESQHVNEWGAWGVGDELCECCMTVAWLHQHTDVCIGHQGTVMQTLHENLFLIIIEW